MKHKFLLVPMAMLALFACKPDAVEPQKQDPSQDPSKEPEKPAVVELTAPVLSVDVNTVTLDPESEAQAVKLTWTSAGEGASYKIEAGTATPSVINASGLEKVLSHKELAALAEAPFTVTFKVKASAEGKSDVWSNGVEVKVEKAAAPVTIPEKLYIYFWGWTDATNAQEMEKIEDGVFSWTGDCTTGEFQFLAANGASTDYATGYSRDDKATEYWTMKPTEGFDEATFKLSDVGEGAGNYTITANANTLKVSYVKNVAPLPEHLYIDTWEWGDGTQAKEMTALGDGKFTWSGRLPRWNMKFTTANATGDDYWTGYFRDPDAENYWTLKETSEQTMFSVGDLGYRDGWYTVNVDLNTLTAEAIPHIWMIGSAFSWGWNLGDAQEMEWKGEGQFTWTGKMFQGPFKFLVVPDEWWGYWRNSTEDDYWLAGENDAGDVQFDIAQNGLEGDKDYTLNFNVLTKKVEVIPVTE